MNQRADSPHLSVLEVQNPLKMKCHFYEWHHQNMYLMFQHFQNQCRRAFWTRCSSFSFQRVRKCIYEDVKAGISHIQTTVICNILFLPDYVLPFTASEWSSAMSSCLTALCRAALSWRGWFHGDPPPWPADPRLIPLSERARVFPAELLSMYIDSSGSTMFRPGEEDRRLDLAEVVPVKVSRASTRFLRRFTSAPADGEHVCIDETVPANTSGWSSKYGRNTKQRLRLIN